MGISTQRLDTRQSGFTLVELAVVVLILGTLAAMAAPAYTNYINAAKVTRAIGDIRALEKDIVTYEAANGPPPLTLADIGRGGLLDPWKRPYEYLNFSTIKGKGPMRKDRFLVPLNSTYDLYSKGKELPGIVDVQPSSEAFWGLLRPIYANCGVQVAL